MYSQNLANVAASTSFKVAAPSLASRIGPFIIAPNGAEAFETRPLWTVKRWPSTIKSNVPPVSMLFDQLAHGLGDEQGQLHAPYWTPLLLAIRFIGAVYVDCAPKGRTQSLLKIT
jgi:hypothetical protein